MNDDTDLLRAFVHRQDQSSFRKLVDRRLGFVYAVNLRRLGDAHLAQDATQAVFVALARKAHQVAESPSVMGWLHRSSCFESRNLLRARANRLARDGEAERLGTTTGAGEASVSPEAIGSVLDEMMNELSDEDREALLARYFSDRTYAEIGLACARSENAVRMRVDRALERLRDRLQSRGFRSSAAVLAGLLPGYAQAVVPGGLAVTVTSTALASLGGVASVAFLTMSATKITAAAVAAVGIVGFLGYEIHHGRQREQELHALRLQHAKSTDQIRGLEKQVIDLRARSESPAAVAPVVASAAGTARSGVGETPAGVVPGITRTAPAGWWKNGSKPGAFDVGVDSTELWGGMPSAYAKSLSTEAKGGFAGMMQTTAAEQYKSRRVRLSGWMKTKEAEGAHLWLRVDGEAGGRPLAFDNMSTRAPKGTTDWAEYSVVLDVPDGARSINYGFFLGGTGHAWVNALRLEPVGNDVPTTNLITPRPLPQQPTNLGFVDSAAKP